MLLLLLMIPFVEPVVMFLLIRLSDLLFSRFLLPGRLSECSPRARTVWRIVSPRPLL